MFQFKGGMRNSLSVAAVFFVLGWTRASASADEILVSAAASLTDVLKEISTGYQSKSKHTVKFNFGPSSGLARQIDEGAPADMFFSADLPQMDKLDKKEPARTRNAKESALEPVRDHRAGGFQARHFVAERSIEGGHQENRAGRASHRAGRRLHQQIPDRRRPLGPGQAQGRSGAGCPRDFSFGRVRQRRSRFRLQNRRRRLQESENRLRSAPRQRSEDYLSGGAS